MITITTRKRAEAGRKEIESKPTTVCTRTSRKLKKNFLRLRCCAMWIWWVREREMEETKKKFSFFFSFPSLCCFFLLLLVDFMLSISLQCSIISKTKIQNERHGKRTSLGINCERYVKLLPHTFRMKFPIFPTGFIMERNDAFMTWWNFRQKKSSFP